MRMMTTVDAHHDATVLERDEFVALYAAMQGHGDAAGSRRGHRQRALRSGRDRREYLRPTLLDAA